MTGSLSAVLVLLGLGISVAGAAGIKIPNDSIIQLGTWFLAAICGCQAAYSVWRREREAYEAEHDLRCASEAKLAKITSPTIKVSILDDGILTIPTQRGSLSKWVQVVVQSTTASALHDCEVWITDVRRIGWESDSSIVEEPVRCQWSQRGDHEALRLTIPVGLQQRANLFVLPEAVTLPATHPVPIPTVSPIKIRLANEIETPGRYLISILVTARDALSTNASFIFEWHDFDNVFLTTETGISSADAALAVPSRRQDQVPDNRRSEEHPSATVR